MLNAFSDLDLLLNASDRIYGTETKKQENLSLAGCQSRNHFAQEVRASGRCKAAAKIRVDKRGKSFKLTFLIGSTFGQKGKSR
jgi:hypothetical protein